MKKDSEDQHIITLTLYITCTLSIIGCIFIISAYFCLKLKHFAYRLVVYLAISDLIHSICLMLPITEPWCRMQAWLLEYSSLSSIFWSSLMAYSLYEAVIHLNSNIERYEKRYLVVGFFIPTLISSLPEISQAYGYSQGWCWIDDHDHDFLYRIFCFYLILALVFCFNIFIYIRVWKKIYNEVLFNLQDEEASKQNSDLVLRLKLYPLVLLISYLPVLSKRVYETIFPGHYIFWMAWAAGVLMSLLGFFDAIVYGFGRDVRSSLKELCRSRSRSLSGIHITSYFSGSLNN